MKWQGIVLLFVTFASDIQSLVWETSPPGHIPQKAFKTLSPTRFRKYIYFCKIDSGLKNNEEIGTIEDDQKSCHVIEDGGNLITSEDYQVLSYTENEPKAIWIYGTEKEIPSNAVSCGDGCYFGHSIYSDGICHESIGRLSASRNVVFMVRDDQVLKCPFYMYLTSNSTLSSDVLPHSVKGKTLQANKKPIKNEHH